MSPLGKTSQPELKFVTHPLPGSSLEMVSVWDFLVVSAKTVFVFLVCLLGASGNCIVRFRKGQPEREREIEGGRETAHCECGRGKAGPTWWATTFFF